MKLTTDKAVDLLIEITPYIVEISADTELREVISKQKKAKKPDEFGLYAGLIPLFLKKYRPAVYKLLGAIYEKTEQEIADQSFTETIGQIKEIASDKELLSFFTSLGGQTPKK
jgi:hypothetical protein